MLRYIKQTVRLAKKGITVAGNIFSRARSLHRTSCVFKNSSCKHPIRPNRYYVANRHLIILHPFLGHVPSLHVSEAFRQANRRLTWGYVDRIGGGKGGVLDGIVFSGLSGRFLRACEHMDFFRCVRRPYNTLVGGGRKHRDYTSGNSV